MTAWFDIPGCSGYQASEDGQIINVRTGRILRQRPVNAGNGAMQVDIGKSTRLVHDLVARAVYGQPLVRGYRVKFLRGNSNHKDNLVWSGAAKVDKPKPPPSQSPTSSLELEQEYDRVRQERLALVELMQS